MLAISQDRYGGSEVLVYGELPAPRLGRSQVRVAMAASSVNPRDLLVRAKKYQLQFLLRSTPLILGSDVAGTVIEVDAQASRFRLGDVVMGMKNPSAGLGCHASEVVIDERALVHRPAQLSVREAGGLPLCGLTAWQALVRHGQLRAGQRVLVIGASGGVGTFAVQIAAALGAEVVAVCSRVNHDWVRALGASALADYREPAYREALGTFDVVFDTIGRDSLATTASMLRRRGRFVTTIPAPKHLARIITTAVLGHLGANGPQVRTVMVTPERADLEALVGLVEAGRLRTVVDSVFPLAEAAHAHDRLATRRARGKVILEGATG
jgi:NADPH:quinone reductase-like Zn-dependent oxidoreductase